MILENAKAQETELMVEESVVEEIPKEIPAELPKKKKSSKKKATAKPKEDKTKENKAEEEIDFAALILQWKAEYKKIYKNEIDDEIVIWRRLKRGEYKNILAQETEDDDNPIMTKQEMMVKAALLYPFDAEALINDNAGVATVLSEEILAKSGFAISYTEEL